MLETCDALLCSDKEVNVCTVCMCVTVSPPRMLICGLVMQLVSKYTYQCTFICVNKYQCACLHMFAFCELLSHALWQDLSSRLCTVYSQARTAHC